jgi:hypothetical protein
VRASAEQQEAVVKALQTYVDKENPDLDKLIARAKQMSAPGALAKEAK